MKTLVIALCALAAAMAAMAAEAAVVPAAAVPAAVVPAAAVPAAAVPAARRPRSFGNAYAYEYDTHHHYEEPHVSEYYTVRAAPAQYSLGARHVVRSARTQYRVQVPVTYEYAFESAPVTSVETYEPAAAYAGHAHYPAATAGAGWGWDEAW